MLQKQVYGLQRKDTLNGLFQIMVYLLINLDVKGLDVKRSSFPKAFQECMGTVLIDILKGKSEEEISDYVVDFKKKMVNRPTI